MYKRQVMVYGDGAFKDPQGKIWELADPVVSPAYTEGLIGTPNEVKLKYLADNDFKDLSGEALKEAISKRIREKSDNLVGDMASQGTLSLIHISQKYNGTFHMRFDDTNPTKEKVEFVESIKEDIKWLGADWKDNLFFASDYFDQMYECAVKLIKKGKAYVCDLTAEEIREYRGTLTEPGRNSPYRERTVEENLELFEAMKNGEFEDGERVLRAKIDMASPNINMRDPIIYRVAHMTHHNTGDVYKRQLMITSHSCAG